MTDFEQSLADFDRSVERREARRFNLSAPVQFTWKRAETEPDSEAGVTRDISPRGIFVLAGTCPPEGATVRISVLLTGASEDSGLEMRADATVVRVEDADAPAFAKGFAVVTKKYLLFTRYNKSRMSCMNDDESFPRPGRNQNRLDRRRAVHTVGSS